MKAQVFILIVLITLCSSLFAETPKPREDKLDEMLFAGVEIQNPQSPEDYAKAWEAFFQVSYKLPESDNEAYFGITYYTEDYVPGEEGGQAYMVAAPVPSLDELPEGVVTRKIPARKYIVFEHHGPMEKVGETYSYIYRDFIPNGSYDVIYADTLERYDHRFMEDPDDSIFEIWIPVQ